MELCIKSGQPEKQHSACLIVGVFGNRRLSPTAEKIDKANQGQLRRELEHAEYEGKLGRLCLLHHIPGIHAKRLLLVGCGPDPLTEMQHKDIIIKTFNFLQDNERLEALFCLLEVPVKNKDILWKIRQTTILLHALGYRFDEFKQVKETFKPLRQFTFLLPTQRERIGAEKALREGLAIAMGITVTKNLANLPANICTPAYLADKAKQFAKQHAKISAAILEEKDMAALKMGALLSVTQGSKTPAKLITLEYRGTHKDINPIVLIGKGITFDTGGNSLKSPSGMMGMKYDMCGGATVFGVLAATLELGLPLNLIGIIPACENMPGPDATKPEDIVKSMSGLTIEILNTDAEGRLILADALTYAERFNPEIVIDIATLTGACAIALGNQASGLMGNNPPLIQDLIKAGWESGDRVWELPIWEEYHEALKGGLADLTNISISDVGAKTILAGCFLSQFAKKFPWAHLDVANTACYFSGPKRSATGRPVSLLMHYLLNRCQTFSV